MSDNQRLPNLYQLLGLAGIDESQEKIAAALKRAQAKLETLRKDGARGEDAARLQKIIALAQKYLLNPELKQTYDAQWSTIYGANASTKRGTPEPTAKAAAVANSQSSTSKSAAATAVVDARDERSKATQTVQALSWDMSSLDSLLPEADPHAPFQMAEYLRTSQVRDPLAAEADLRKLISLLSGEEHPATPVAAVVAQPIGLAPRTDDEDIRIEESNTSIDMDRGIVLPRSSNSAAAVGLAKRMRRKKQQAIMFGGIALAAGVGGLFLLSMYLNQPTKKSDAVAQVNQPAPPKRPSKPAVEETNLDATALLADANKPATNKPATAAEATGLIRPGEAKPLEIQATPMAQPSAEPMQPEAMKPDAAKPDSPKPEPAKPEPPKPDAPKPEPAKPEPAKSDAPKPDPSNTEPAKPEPTKPEPVEVKLTGKEKSAWQRLMKDTRAALGKLDPAASEKQIAELTPLAKTPQQKAQLATLEQAVGLIRRAREAIVAGIQGLESAETFTVGNSTEVSFIEGDETRIVYFSKRERKEYKLEAMPMGVGVALMKLKPNVLDANMSAAMGAYAMVHPNGGNSTQGKKLLEEAAASGAISKELSTFYAEDYKLD